MSNQKKSKDSDSYTVDLADSDNSDAGNDVPSVTKLLNRKSLTEALHPAKPSASRAAPSSGPSKPTLPPVAPKPVLTPTPPPKPIPVEPPVKTNTPPEAVSVNVTSDESFIIESSGGTSTSTQSPVTSTQVPTPTESSVEIAVKTDSPSSGSLEIETGFSKSNISSPSIEVPTPVRTPAEGSGSIQTSSSIGKVQPATRRNRSNQKLILWDLNQLKIGPDPIGRGIALAIQNGAVGALFLGIVPPAAGSTVPLFIATAAVQAPQKLNIWTGLKWDPTVVPDMWNFFVKSGTVELSPPGSFTSANSNRNVVRSAFGIHQSEWLLLVRAGPATACRGIVAIITTRSILSELEEIATLIGSPAPAGPPSPAKK